jgi:hypothetical protein
VKEKAAEIKIAYHIAPRRETGLGSGNGAYQIRKICFLKYYFRYKLNIIKSMGMYQWYINRTITILDIIHRPVFYLKHNSTL